MKVLQLILIGILGLVALMECANPIRPTGGPKDTIPPSLLSSNPVDQTLNFKGKTVMLEFDEYINADKLKQKLIITPTVKGTYKHVLKKEKITIEFDDPFRDSTTYTLNFFDGLTDITEKNPAENLIIAFSTTSYIDSLKISGMVEDVLTKEAISKITIGLYAITDSLDIFTAQPTYFITTDESGSFLIQNIRTDKYLLLAFNDENKNLKFDPEAERHAFAKDTIVPKFIPDTLSLHSIKVNASELKLVNAKPSAKYFDIRYSKPITEYSLLYDSTQSVYHKLQAEGDVIRIYNSTNNYTDSIQLIVTAFDTLRNTRSDTLYAKFRESAKKNSALEHTTTPKKGAGLKGNESISLAFNKPLFFYKFDSITLLFDTLKLNHPSGPLKISDDNSTISFHPIAQSAYYSLLDTLISKRSGLIDSMDILYTTSLEKLPKDKIKFTLPAGSFRSIESDTSKLIEFEYKFLKPEEVGTIKYVVTTRKESYFVQLIDKKLEVVQTLYNCTDCVFTKVSPGDYSVRILIDDNKDGKWTIGNIFDWELPESTYIHEEYTTLRANWSVEVTVEF